VSLVKEWLKFVLSNRHYWKNGEIVKSGMVLDMISICYEKRRNGRHLADSDYRSCLWLYLCSYELYLPQLDNLTAKTKGGAVYIAKPDASPSTPSKPLTYVLPLVRYGVEQEAVWHNMQILRNSHVRVASLVKH
jgi:hypothetical protein